LYRVVLTKRAIKDLDRAPDHINKRASEAIEALQESFAPVKLFDVKKLKGMEDTFRIRLGDWRLIYEFKRKDSLIIVYEIAPRGRAY
jgi:mRNA interferase RelE/StbE